MVRWSTSPLRRRPYLRVRFGQVDAVPGIDLYRYAGTGLPCSAATARASRPPCGSWPVSSRPTAGSATVAGPTSATDTLDVKRAPATAPTSAAWCRARRPGSTCSCRPPPRPADWEAAPATCSSGSTSGTRHTGSPPASATAWAGGCRSAGGLPPARVLLLDEPFDGVDPLGVEATLEVIDDARARGSCLLVSTHLRELAVEACQRRASPARRARSGHSGCAGDGGRGGAPCIPRPPGLRSRRAPARRGHLVAFRAGGVPRPLVDGPGGRRLRGVHGGRGRRSAPSCTARAVPTATSSTH